jgi:hypothetical protein
MSAPEATLMAGMAMWSVIDSWQLAVGSWQ